MACYDFLDNQLIVDEKPTISWFRVLIQRLFTSRVHRPKDRKHWRNRTFRIANTASK